MSTSAATIYPSNIASSMGVTQTDKVLINLREAALNILQMSVVADKLAALTLLTKQVQLDCYRIDSSQTLAPNTQIPGRPVKPMLVSPAAVPKRSLNNSTGRAILLHALAHIEFNAINLALDIIWRFAHLPIQFYLDWLKVAADEAFHFTLLCEHLQTLNTNYGDYSAHHGLWEMAERTNHDVVVRLALVPRVLEARGLDVSPLIRERLLQAGDERAAEILSIILRDEITHVACGNKWYNFLCEERGLSPWQHFLHCCRTYASPKTRPPLNVEDRLAAGFTQVEIDCLLAGLD